MSASATQGGHKKLQVDRRFQNVMFREKPQQHCLTVSAALNSVLRAERTAKYLALLKAKFHYAIQVAVSQTWSATWSQT